MGRIAVGDWVAIYAAALSTVLALVALGRWFFSGPRLAITVFSPDHTAYHGAFLAVISNIGGQPVVVQSLCVSFRTSRWPWGREIGSATFNERTSWKPTVKLVPSANKPNSFQEEPNIIRSGEELRAPARPVRDYDSAKHWIRVAAKPRNSRKRFVGWANPSPKADVQESSE